MTPRRLLTGCGLLAVIIVALIIGVFIAPLVHVSIGDSPTTNANTNTSTGNTPPAGTTPDTSSGATPTQAPPPQPTQATNPVVPGTQVIVSPGDSQSVSSGDCVDYNPQSGGKLNAPTQWTKTFTLTHLRSLVSGSGNVIGPATIYQQADICSQIG